MIIPPFEATLDAASGPAAAASPTRAQACWSSLTPEAKVRRLLSVAGEVFAARGLDTPMSEIACAAGAGVASIYRLFPSKQALLAALVVRRMDQITAMVAEAEARPGSRFEALAEMLRSVVRGQPADDLMGDARVIVAGNPDVEAATDRTTDAIERLLCAARAEGRLRADASTTDVRLLFAATRAAKRIEPGQAPRMLELMLDALEARPAHEAH
jgi:AcrR family transcriptional regulator